MLILNGARECDQALHEVHDLPQSVFGLESYLKRVKTLVTSEGSHGAPRYVGVWGMGGVGKTLLLQTLYGSPEVQGHFEGADFIYLTVGKTPDIMALYWTLSKKLHLDPELHGNPGDYKRYLHTCFIQKRVFLVLDDVWKEKAFDSLDLAKGTGSVTLLSTRNQSLLERAGPHLRQEHMTPLSEEHSWSLFCVHAFRQLSNVPFELKAVAQSIAKQCQGLPLALKVIGRAMSGKTSREFQWEPVLRDLSHSRLQDRTVIEKLYECLEVGYDLLDEDDRRLKQCFHYFASFPEDEEIQFDTILCHWIGEGLVPLHDGDDPTADALSLLSMLWERSFIESDGEVDPNEKDFLSFRLHDVMKDLALYILEKYCGTPPAKQIYFYRAGQNLEEVPKDCRATSEALRLSLDSNKLETLPESFYAPKLVSLLLGGNPIVSLPANFWRSLELRVLDLSGGKFQNLPEELGDLKNLVCLDLSMCQNLQILPEAVRKLQLLKILNLFFCMSLKYLPSGVVGLTSLQVFKATYCESLKLFEYMPSGMARGESLGPTIRASLEDIYGLVVLTELRISGRTDSQMELPHNTSALTKLKFLELRLIDVKTLPARMGYRCIQLQELDLSGCMNLECLPRLFTCHGAFPALVTFQLRHCSRLVAFPEVEEGALPKLRTLDFSYCESLASLPLSLDILTSMRLLDLSYCKQTTLNNSCRINCEKSSIWRSFDIRSTYRM